MTLRNTDLLSNKDMFVKYANVVEVSRTATITIQHNTNKNLVRYLGFSSGKHKFVIESATPNVEGIEKFVGIIHELGHVLFESPFIASSKLINAWSEDKGLHALYMNVFNVLEDQRIESQMGRMYIKHGERFIKTRERLGILMKDKVKYGNPVDILLGIRFMRGEDIENYAKNYYEYQTALDDSELTDRYGALRVLVSIKPLIDDYYSSQSKKRDELMIEKSDIGITPDELKAINNELGAIDFERRVMVMNERNDNARASGEDPAVPIPEDLEGLLDMDSDEIDEMLNSSKEEGSHVVDDIYDALRDGGTIDRTPSGVKFVKRDAVSSVQPNIQVVRGLSKIFKQLMMKRRNFIDTEGDSIDIEEFVERLVSGNDMGNCRINNKVTHGTSIVISIDASGSMAGDSIETARNLVATMFESTKNLDNVIIKANIWASNGKGECGITEIHNQKDVKMITVNHGYAFTPTHMAFEHSARMLRSMKGSKKMLILITDGSPNFHKNGFRIPDKTYVKMCKKSLLKAMNVTTNIMCVVVQPRAYYRNNSMQDIMKSSNIIRVDSMNMAAETVIKRFKQLIMRNIA